MLDVSRDTELQYIYNMYYTYETLPTISFYHVLIFAFVKTGRFETGTLFFALTRVLYIIVEGSVHKLFTRNK